MKNNNSTTFIIITGVLVLCVFIAIITLNLLPNFESNSYYVKVENEISAKIESVDIHDNKLVITTSGDPIKYCVKSTRTAPTSNALCWNIIENNSASISIFKHKKYYVWIKDNNGNISNFLSVNPEK